MISVLAIVEVSAWIHFDFFARMEIYPTYLKQICKLYGVDFQMDRKLKKSHRKNRFSHTDKFEIRLEDTLVFLHICLILINFFL